MLKTCLCLILYNFTFVTAKTNQLRQGLCSYKALFYCYLVEGIYRELKDYVHREGKQKPTENWLQRYVSSDIHEIFFATFLIEMHAWLSQLAENETFNHNDRPMRWTPELIQRLKRIDNPISRAMDFG